MSFKMKCPNCNRVLNVTEKAFGKTVPCPGCNQPVSVPHPAQPSHHASYVAATSLRSGTVQDSRAMPISTVPSPPGMPSVPDDSAPAEPQSDPLAFLRSESAAAPPSPRLPAGMPPLPQISEESDPPRNSADLLAKYSSTAKAKGAEIKQKLTRAVGTAKKRALALKLGHELKSLQTAIAAQLAALGTLTLTHRPSTVDIGQQVADLSQVQEELSQKQTTLESLRHTKGSGSVVKELNHEVAQLQSRQKAVMSDIGRRTLTTRPAMPGAAGPYAALDRLALSLEAKQNELKVIEEDIGPVWNITRMGFGTVKRPFVFAGVAAGALLLLYLLWTLLAVGLFGVGYRAEYRPLIENGQPFLEVKVTGKATKLAVMLTDPNGKTETQIIEENEMITNEKVVRLPMERKPAPGTYALAMKTFQPERVVYRASPKYSRGKLTILDAAFKWKPWTGGGHQQPEAITLTVENQGSLPVCFDRVLATIDDQKCEPWCVVEGMNGKIETIRVGGAFFVRDNKVREAEMGRGGLVLLGGFLPGTYPATIKLYVAGDEEQFLTFQKEVVVPAAR